MKNYRMYKLLSLFLALLMALSAVPCVAIEAAAEPAEPTQDTALSEPTSTEVFVVQEDTTKRGEFEKHYICSDGTYVVTTYAEAIHYKDEQGAWVDVENRPISDASGAYTVQNGDFGISVPASADEGHLMRMEKGDHTFSWTLTAEKSSKTAADPATASTMALQPAKTEKMRSVSGKRAEVVVTESATTPANQKILRDEADFKLPHISGKVRYDDLFGTDEGISVVYTTYHNKIEEDIYIEKPTDITSFSMDVAAPELTPRLNADNSVDFLDNTGKMCYHIGVPYMMDADFAVLNDIETTVTRSGDGWIVTYTPDATWFTSEERAYPILLDPSITTDEYIANIVDTYVQAGSAESHAAEQYMYLSYGGNDCKAVVRVNNLPAIDPTMPIIDASFTFVAANGPFSGSTAVFQLDYSTLYGDEAFTAYTYERAVEALSASEFSSGTYLTYNTTVATFSLTDHIYQILDEGNGDFFLSYDPDYGAVYCGPFCSSENTNASMRPVMSVTYGYSLPANLLNGQVVAFQNFASVLFASVGNTDPANYANVYQVARDNNIPTTTELFRVHYNSESGAYRLYSMASDSGTGGMLTVKTPTNGLIGRNQNVRLEYLNSTTETTQEWFIVCIGGGAYRLIPRSNMSKCLTASGDTEGTSAATGVDAPGNIYVKTLEANSNFQKWYVVDSGGHCINNDYPNSILENGVYYFINRHSGRYLYLNGNVVMSTRGLMTDIRKDNNVFATDDSPYKVYSEYIAWRITNLGDGYCTIQNSQSMNYLYVQSNSTGSSVRLGGMNESIPDQFKWRIYSPLGGGVFLINKLSGDYLTLNETSIETRNADVFMTEPYSSNSDEFEKQTWNSFKVENYKEMTTFTANELNLYVGQSSRPTILTTPSDASLKNLKDFIYSGEVFSSLVTVDSNTGAVTGVKAGEGDMVLRHKTTGVLGTMDINVYDCPELFTSFFQNGYLKYDDVKFTDDGCYIMTKSLADILNRAGIYTLYEDEAFTQTRPVLNYYDDWYIYAIVDGDTEVYSLYKMREQEYDKIDDFYADYDEDAPGVSVSFVPFATTLLTACINEPSAINLHTLLCDMDTVTNPGKKDYDSTIVTYFSSVDSCGAYIIADAYIRLIASFHENNQIQASDKLIDLFARASSLSDIEKDIYDRAFSLINTYNDELGYSIYDLSEHKINISNENHLTDYEKNVILVTFTANASLDSFAAEVRAHAKGLTNPWVSFFKANLIKADMTIETNNDKERTFYNSFYNYHNPENAFLKEQINAHANCLHS